ncbi:MAG: glycosyltransferase [Candidatus Adiutricales bacterium]
MLDSTLLPQSDDPDRGILLPRGKIESIICLSTQPWNDFGWTNKRQVMGRLAARIPLLYVFPGSSVAGAIRSCVLGRLSFKSLFRRFEQKGEKLWVYLPLTSGLDRFVDKFRDFDLRRVSESVNHYSQELGFKNPVLWIYDPMALALVNQLEKRLIVYDCVDDFKYFPAFSDPKKRARMIAAERELVRQANLVLTTAPALYESKKSLNPNTYFTPNAGDPDHFGRAMQNDLPIPKEIAGLRKPLIGFYGALSDYKVDLELLIDLAREKPEYNFILIGQVGVSDRRTDIRELKNQSNVFLLGPRPYQDLPAFVKGFDVLMIPYRINEYTRSCYPIKFHEMLATGKPVVITRLEALSEFHHLVYTAQSREDFINLIEKALSENDPEVIKKRVAAARENTWDKKVERLMGLVESALGNGNEPS